MLGIPNKIRGDMSGDNSYDAPFTLLRSSLEKESHWREDLFSSGSDGSSKGCYTIFRMALRKNADILATLSPLPMNTRAREYEEKGSTCAETNRSESEPNKEETTVVKNERYDEEDD
ncbi:hypothetical protein, unlikely [Trypanosoma congolense IL3000]|uniref:Uncharacterized protein n=1 Tax=Trypanosoma congolense (strain IL3000) TaxID=1068625 RepID=F9WFW2_TRYCI|nr:hypothetical protein, unlikely [Trypanosoma congolense IL3000]